VPVKRGAAQERRATSEREALLLALARGMHRYGAPSHRLEGALAQVADAIGIEARFFASPTFLMIAFGHPEDARTSVLRTEPGETDLGKLGRVDAVALAVVEGALPPAEALRRLDVIERAPDRYGRLITLLAFGVASGTFAVFLGGGVPDVFAGTAIGLVIGALATVVPAKAGGAQVFDLLAALLAAFLAGLFARVGPVSVYVATVAGLIVLMPGFTLTIGLNEVAMRHLASGTARLTSAGMTFLKIGVGTAIGERLAMSVPGKAALLPPMALPSWSVLIALLLSAPALAVLWKAPARAFGWQLLVCGLGFAGSQGGAVLLGSELGAAVGALAVATAGNIYARRFKRPSATVIVPGIIQLVPGSIGFRSLSSLMDNDVTAGIDALVSMSIVAASIVAGMLAANALVPPRRAL
jgi:uncharacterized membrane protein YjjP (DUF1212 family)